MFIGMVSPPIPKAKDQPQKQAVKTEAARRVTQTMHENEYQQALETVKEKIRENEGQDMKEKMQDQIRQWFIEVRYLTFTHYFFHFASSARLRFNDRYVQVLL